MAQPATIHECLESILANYTTTVPIGGKVDSRGDPVWKDFEAFRKILLAQTSVKGRGLVVKFSMGAGWKSAIPWIILSDSRITTGASKGVYCVYLFRADQKGVYLTFNQASTVENFGNVPPNHLQELANRASELREYCDGLTHSGFSCSNGIDLASKKSLARGYEAGTVAHKYYAAGRVPNDETLEKDLEAVLSAYDKYVLSRLSGESISPLSPLGKEPVREDSQPEPDRGSSATEPKPAVAEPPAVVETHPEHDFEWLRQMTFWPEDRLQRICSAITDSWEPVVLAGPPGTGKSWVAEHIALYLTRNGEVLRSVQFHPSYSYEDFMLGIRPRSVDGAISFDEEPGFVLRTVEDIKGKPGQHIVVIEEFNRANLPKVLGEFMYLVEYREKRLPLRWNRSFGIPKNLHFICTMNTADRSIRSIDSALRRRLNIVECLPDPDILDAYYTDLVRQNDVPKLSNGFRKLNEALTKDIDKHHTIGHGLLMVDHMNRPILKSIWEGKVKPLIEEYFFNAPADAETYKLEEFWPE